MSNMERWLNNLNSKFIKKEKEKIYRVISNYKKILLK